MENNTIVKEINGITHYINPKFEKIMDGIEEKIETPSTSPLFNPPTEEEILNYKIVQKRINAKKYLLETDWYIIRQLETGIAIPEEIRVKRTQARIDSNT
jgi:hypothetical protein